MERRTNPAFRRILLATTGLAIGISAPAYAQGSNSEGIQEIIVTAQKREQNVQDVPIAITALGQEQLEANRVVSVTDLTGLAPGLTVAESAGGQKIPFFIMRGANSAGLVPGSDKQVSLYLDGVYLGSTRGSIFDLPDVSRIEVLRGPQGTLFGRNATAGAVGVYTRDPKGEWGGRVEGSVGNYGHYRILASLDLPQVGPFSGYVSYVRTYRRGDIENVGAGQVWDRRASLTPRVAKVTTSPRYLGTVDGHGVFAALKFQSGDFTTVYKFDWNKDTGTNRGTALIDYNKNVPLLGNFLDTLIRTQPVPVPLASDGLRPKTVSNAFVVPTDQESSGHNLTSTWQASDSITVKNILAYRKSYIAGPSAIDGVSSLVITQQSILPFATLSAFSTLPPAQAAGAIPTFVQQLTPLIGSPWVGVAGLPEARSWQVSDELQLNYTSEKLTATIGALWFLGKDWVNEHGLQNTLTFAPIFGGVIRNANIGINYNKQVSIAAYAQLEYRITPQVEVVGGIRVTSDKKSGTFTYGPTLSTLKVSSFEYKKTRPTFLVGVNWKPNEDTLIYGKFSTGFVSGGSVAGLEFEPETVTSFEAGIKADFLDRKLRTNLALFQASYKHVQGPSAPTSPEAAALVDTVCGCTDLKSFIGTFVADLGDINAKGFELDITAKPSRYFTLGGSLSYTDTDYVKINPLQIPANGILPVLTNRAPWRGSVYGQFDSPRIGMGDAYVSLRLDAFWQDKYYLTPSALGPDYQAGGFARLTAGTPAYWLINGRISLREVPLGPTTLEIAAWGKNLTDKRVMNAGLNLSGIMVSGNYIPARTYGLDLNIKF